MCALTEQKKSQGSSQKEEAMEAGSVLEYES